jgi:uncharacterized protein YsxB (DUF464 family)
LIKLNADFDEDGVLVRCAASGHAGAAAAGSDIVCAAVSVLLRTAVRAVSGRAGISAGFSAPERGCFEFFAQYSAAGRDFLYATGVFLYEGLKSIAEEYPAYCSITVNNIRV